MGVAAYNRGSQVISNQIDNDYDLAHKVLSETLTMMLEKTELYNAYYRTVLSVLVDPRGLLSGTIKHKQQKTKYKKLMEVVGLRHCEWVDCNYMDIIDYFNVSKARAKAIHDAYVYALSGWAIPSNIVVPGDFR